LHQLGYRLDDQEIRDRFLADATAFFQSSIHLVLGFFALGIKRPRREADYSPPYTNQVKTVKRNASAGIKSKAT
jgi:hypothetical protein